MPLLFFLPMIIASGLLATPRSTNAARNKDDGDER
jgi:hypothetical protein